MSSNPGCVVRYTTGSSVETHTRSAPEAAYTLQAPVQSFHTWMPSAPTRTTLTMPSHGKPAPTSPLAALAKVSSISRQRRASRRTPVANNKACPSVVRCTKSATDPNPHTTTLTCPGAFDSWCTVNHGNWRSTTSCSARKRCRASESPPERTEKPISLVSDGDGILARRGERRMRGEVAVRPVHEESPPDHQGDGSAEPHRLLPGESRCALVLE